MELFNWISTLQAFHEAVEKAVEYKKDPEDIDDQIMEELEKMWTNSPRKYNLFSH